MYSPALSEEIADMFSCLEGCLDRSNSAGLSYRVNVEASPERRDYKTSKQKAYDADPARKAARKAKDRARYLAKKDQPIPYKLAQ